MTTLAEIKAAADTLSAGDREELLRHLAASLHREPVPPGPRLDYGEKLEDILAEKAAGGRPRQGLTPEEFEAWWKQAAGVGVSGMTTDEHMAMTRGDE